jgi:peptidyl-tRNA hydrolase
MQVNKLYIVTRADLSPGSRAVQALHAATTFSVEHSEIFRQWFSESNYLCLLEVPNEQSLKNLAQDAYYRNIRFSKFQEPDLNNSLTAIALEPIAKCLCRKFPLALT